MEKREDEKTVEATTDHDSWVTRYAVRDTTHDRASAPQTSSEPTNQRSE